MPYRFVENTVAVSYMGVQIYHVYRNDYEEQGPREFWFTKDPCGCETDGNAFDIRGLPDYDPTTTVAANLVRMIRNGVLGPVPDSYDRYVDEDNSCAGICPVCQHEDLDYGSFDVQDDSIAYPFECPRCGVSGNEYAALEFNGFGLD